MVQSVSGSWQPFFSVVVPVFNVEEKWLRKCLESVLAQSHANWELCIADDASAAPHVRTVLQEYAAKDRRIKVFFRKENGGIAAASNSALRLAEGDFVAFLDHDDELTPDALAENARLLARHPEADFIYSDEDKIDEAGRTHSPFFKPDWSPDTFLSQMYTCHLSVYRRTLIQKVGGFRGGFEGSQDYDLVLRLTELTTRIFHIPKILYHWRTLPQSTAANASAKGYTHDSGLEAVKQAVRRRGAAGWVEPVENFRNLYRVHYLVAGEPLISILIPVRDQTGLLSSCLSSIFQSTGANFEVIVLDHGSSRKETFRLFAYWKEREPGRFRVERMAVPFNLAKLINFGVRKARGEFIQLLSSDIVVRTANWLTEMAGFAQRPAAGAVGAKLLYQGSVVQHAGIILGIRGLVGHSHRGLADGPGYFGRLAVISNYSAVTGACLMVRKAAYKAVGGFDEGLKAAFADVDFCLKLLCSGLFSVVLPHIQMERHSSANREHTPAMLRSFPEETAVMWERWRPLLENDPFYNPNLTREYEDFSPKFIGGQGEENGIG